MVLQSVVFEQCEKHITSRFHVYNGILSSDNQAKYGKLIEHINGKYSENIIVGNYSWQQPISR